MAPKFVSRDRVNVHEGISVREVKELSKNTDLSVLQFAEPLSEQTHLNLQEHFFSARPDVTLRVYGFYNLVCDLSFLKHFPNLRKFSADCIMEAENIDSVRALEHLEDLTIGIFKLDSFDFLDDIPDQMNYLSLQSTFSKKPSIKALSRFKILQRLYLEGQWNGIESIAQIAGLKEIVLRSISTKNLDFLKGLDELWSVDIKLGGIKEFDALCDLTNLKYLELWQVNKLSDISFISDLNTLQYLFMQSLRNVNSLPSFKGNSVLRRIGLENMKGLKNMDSLRDAPVLEEFFYIMAQNQQPEDLTPVLENKNIKRVSAWFGSDKKNNKFNEMIRGYGKESYEYHPFEYR